MGTGIVSIALDLDGSAAFSDVLMWVTCGLWVALIALLPGAPLRSQMARPDSLTAVAGTCVLGTRLTIQGWHWAGAALLVGGALAWPPLLVAVLRHRRRRARGVEFLTAVSAQGLAVLAATLARTDAAPWLATVAVVAFAAGLVLYVLALAAFDPAQLAVGSGDHWIAGGALAISALAAGSAAVARAFGGREPLATIALGLWWLAMAWLPALLVAELRHPRPRWGTTRWATVFPLGMYAAMSYVVGGVARHPWIADFARVWTWAACAGWVVAVVVSVRHPGRG